MLGRLSVVLAVAGAFALAGLGPAAAGLAQAPAPSSTPLMLSAGSSQRGWIALTVSGPAGGPVQISERVGGRERNLTRMDLAGGRSVKARAVAWTCRRRTRVLTATRTQPDGALQRATATIKTPSCARRLALIVAPARLRPGQRAQVRVADTWRRGGLSARVCARTPAVSAGCRRVRLGRGQVRVRSGVRLARSGRWTVTLKTAFTRAVVTRRVDVRRGARYRVLVTGDSMVYGLIDVLTRSVRSARGTLIGDPHPATGISRPMGLSWTAHATRSARRERPDASVVFLGAIADAFPLNAGGGRTVECCGSEWVAAYSRRVRAMMTSYLRAGSALVFWVLPYTPRDVARVEATRAIRQAIIAAAARFADGVRLVDLQPAISPGDIYREQARYRGTQRTIRASDGIHLANAGVHIASEVILRAMRRDGVAMQ